MSTQQKAPNPPNVPTAGRRGWEALLFLVASVLGVYSLGQGLTGFFTGQTLNLGWLAVAGITLFVLTAQMGRVHDAWPHRSAPSPIASREPGYEDPPQPESR
jgi:hypothetical protein